MRRRMTATAAGVLAVALIPAAQAESSMRSDSMDRFGKSRVVKYEELHRWATKQFGRATVGRQVVRDGMPKRGADRLATRAEFRTTLGVLARWKNPPAPPPVEDVSSGGTVAATGYSGGAAPSVVQCESGGDYSINTGNGYYGGYQFDSGTWDAYGDPAYAEAHLAPPAVQDAAAAAVPYDAWPNC